MLQSQMIDKWGDRVPNLMAGFVHVKAFVSKGS